MAGREETDAREESTNLWGIKGQIKDPQIHFQSQRASLCPDNDTPKPTLMIERHEEKVKAHLGNVPYQGAQMCDSTCEGLYPHLKTRKIMHPEP